MSESPKTWLEAADMLIAMAKQAQKNGDVLASLDLAAKAQECLMVHKNLDEAGKYLSQQHQSSPGTPA